MIMAALRAGRHMPTEPHCPASFNRAHHLQLATVQMSGIIPPVSGPVIAEDIRDLQPLCWHWRSAGCSPGLITKLIQRAHDIAQRARCHMGVARSAGEL